MRSRVFSGSSAVLFGLGMFVTVGHAQLLTADYSRNYGNPGYYDPGGLSVGGEVGGAVTQTFTGVTSINTITWRITAMDTVFSAYNSTAYFSEWSGSHAVAQLGSDLTLMLPDSSQWFSAGKSSVDGSNRLGYDLVFDLTGVAGSLDSSKTYGLTTAGDANTWAIHSSVVLNLTAPYANGSLYTHSGVTGFSNLTSGASGSPPYDLAFVASATVPETSTVVVLLAMLLIGGLVAKRLWRRHRSTAIAS